MPFLRDFATKEVTAVSQVTASMPVYQANDLLLWMVGRQTSSGSTPFTRGLQTPAGWTKGDERTFGALNGTTNTTRGAWFYKIATSTTESAPATIMTNVGTATGSVAYHSVLLSFGAVDTSIPINASSSASSSNVLVNPYMPALTSSALTTTSGSCLLLFACVSDGAVDPTNYPETGLMHILGQDATNVSVGAAWTIQYNSGAVPTNVCRFYNTSYSGNESVLFSVAINNSGSTGIPAYVDRTTTPATLIDSFNIFGVTETSSSYKTTPLSIPFLSAALPRTGLIPTLFDAAAATADYGLNPYHPAIASSPAITTGLTSSGFELQLTSSGIGRNFSSGALLFSTITGNPRDYTDLGKINPPESGLIVTFADIANNYRSYHYGAQYAVPNFVGRMLACVQPTVTSSVIAISTGTLDTTKINKILFTASDPRGAVTYYFSQLVALNKLVMVGGTSASLSGMDDLILCGQSYPLNYVEKQGAAGCLSYIPIQLGGSDPSFIDINASALQFPRFYDPDNKQINFHVSASWVGISYNALPGDIIKHRNSVIASPSQYYWQMHPSSSAAASYDFSGLTIVGAAPVTLRNVVTYSAMTFNDCGQIDATECNLLGCSISSARTGSVSAIKITSGSTLNNCTFTTAVASDYAIELPQTASYTLTNVTFNGFTKALFASPSTGTVTVNIVGGSTPSYATNGATVVINNTKTFSLTGLIIGSEVKVYNATTGAELASDTSVVTSTFTYQYNYVSDIPIYVVIFSLSYKEIRMEGLTLTSTNQTIPIQQQVDRVYNNPP